MAADLMIDETLERPKQSLKDMGLLPYIIVYDTKTGQPADITQFNPDGSPALDFKKYGDLHFLYDGVDVE